MDAGFKGPVFYQNNLFVIQGYNVLLYTPRGKFLDFMEFFSFADPVEKLEPKPSGLAVRTTHSYYIIAGGPTVASYYTALLAAEVDDNQVLSDDLSCLTRNFPNQKEE